MGNRSFSRLCLLLGIVLLAPKSATSEEPEAGSDVVSPVRADDLASEAETSWRAISNVYDAAALDRFIERFPGSTHAERAFALRVEVLRRSRSIDAYNDFIRRYPDRLASVLAISEVYAHYAEVGRLELNLDFCARYPNTIHAIVAWAKAEAQLFDVARIGNTPNDYDRFICALPHSAYVPAAAACARMRLFEIERERIQQHGDWLDTQGLDGLERERELDRWKHHNCNEWMVRFGEALTVASRVADPGEAAMHLHRAGRIADLVMAEYARYDAALVLRQEKRHAELIDKLDAIRVEIRDSGQALIRALQVEFDALRKTVLSTNAALRAELVAQFEAIDRRLETIGLEINELQRTVLDAADRILRAQAESMAVQQETARALGEANRAVLHLDVHLADPATGLANALWELATPFVGRVAQWAADGLADLLGVQQGTDRNLMVATSHKLVQVREAPSLDRHRCVGLLRTVKRPAPGDGEFELGAASFWSASAEAAAFDALSGAGRAIAGAVARVWTDLTAPPDPGDTTLLSKLVTSAVGGTARRGLAGGSTASSGPVGTIGAVLFSEFVVPFLEAGVEEAIDALLHGGDAEERVRNAALRGGNEAWPGLGDLLLRVIDDVQWEERDALGQCLKVVIGERDDEEWYDVLMTDGLAACEDKLEQVMTVEHLSKYIFRARKLRSALPATTRHTNPAGK